MQYSRCKCGKCERWDSGEAVHPCEGCEACGTTFAQGPDGHLPLEPHEWEPRFNPLTGDPDRPECKRCNTRQRAKR